MTKKQIFDAIGMIDEKAVLDAKAYRAPATNLWLKVAAVAACLTIAIGGTVLVLNRPTLKTFLPILKGGTDTTQSGIEMPYMQWNINHGNWTPDSMDMDVELTHYGSISEQSEAWEAVMAEFFDHTGIRYRALENTIPADMQANATLCTIAAPQYDPNGVRGDGYQLHDYVFDFYSENGAHIEIAICHFEPPLRDVFFESDTKPSYINGTEVMIVAFSETDYNAQFCDGGVWYDITAQGIPLETMQDLLIGIVNLK